MRKSRRKRYLGNLRAGTWNPVRPLFPDSAVGRPPTLSLRQVLNATFYVVKTGCQWRQLPREFPPWNAVYYYFRHWRRDGTWPRIHETLRVRLRQKLGRRKHRSAGCLDSQSVKGTATPGARGYDAGKKINGRKRHPLVDTLGLVLIVVVTAESVQDRDGARHLLRRLPGSGKKLRCCAPSGPMAATPGAWCSG